MKTHLFSLTFLTVTCLLIAILTVPDLGFAKSDPNSLMGGSGNSTQDLNSLMGNETGSSQQFDTLSGSQADNAYFLSDKSLQSYILALGYFINGTLIPVIFGLGLLFFLYNTFRYFILKSNDTTAREQAKTQALYGILAFVFLVSIWGIVNMFIYGLDLYDDTPVDPDYIENSSYGGSSSGSWLDGLMGGGGNNNTDLNSKMGNPGNDPYIDLNSMMGGSR